MSIFSMLVSGAAKDFKSNAKIQAALQEIKTAETKLLPIIEKLDPAAVEAAIVNLSGGKLTTTEIQTVLLEGESLFAAFKNVAAELETIAK